MRLYVMFFLGCFFIALKVYFFFFPTLFVFLFNGISENGSERDGETAGWKVLNKSHHTHTHKHTHTNTRIARRTRLTANGSQWTKRLWFHISEIFDSHYLKQLHNQTYFFTTCDFFTAPQMIKHSVLFWSTHNALWNVLFFKK